VLNRRDYSKSATNASSSPGRNFAMSRDCGRFSCHSIEVQGMLLAFAHELTTVLFQMPD
jgi:hypothetical protein